MRYMGLIGMLLVCSFGAMAGLRTWTLPDGRSIEAEFVGVMGGGAVLKTPAGRVDKIKLEELSEEDRTFIELANPPRFELSFRRKTKQKHFSPRFGSTLLPEIQINTFGARVRQRGAGMYNHELRIEFLAIGKERAGDRHILLDRYSDTFTPSKENSRAHEFWGRAVELDEYEIYYIDKPRGKKYAGHLILLTDERGELVARQATHAWLLENLDALKQLPVGAYMDKTCKRTFPTRPRPTRY